ncbi:MAG: hypothetical protein DMG15_25310 [Acidobacteria bacterium]|nr:MAG: hypothetical protein DMG15_25310 [Acidobacteriota bacterium]
MVAESNPCVRKSSSEEFRILVAVSSGWSVLMTGPVDLKLNVFKLWNGKSAPVKANVERVQIRGRARGKILSQ